MSIDITARKLKEKSPMSMAIKSEINSLAHLHAQINFIKHRNHLRAQAIRLIATGSTEDEVIDALREMCPD